MSKEKTPKEKTNTTSVPRMGEGGVVTPSGAGTILLDNSSQDLENKPGSKGAAIPVDKGDKGSTGSK